MNDYRFYKTSAKVLPQKIENDGNAVFSFN